MSSAEEQVIEPFCTTKPIGMGTGLKLSIINRFAKQSGGAISIYYQGTMVCIYLPRHMGAASEEVQDPELAQAPRAQAGETILVVEHEPNVKMLVGEVLADLSCMTIEADAARFDSRSCSRTSGSTCLSRLSACGRNERASTRLRS